MDKKIYLLGIISLLSAVEFKSYSQSIFQNPDKNRSLPPVDLVPEANKGVTIKEQLGKKIDLNIKFIDQNGNPRTLKNLTEKGKPILLTLNYYRCVSLCSVQLLNLAKTLKELNWPVGKDFTVLTVSFDPKDTYHDAKKKQIEYLDKLGQDHAEWNFFVGDSKSIETITKDVGFYYKFIPENNEYSHTAAIFFIAPDGTITRYVYGISYKVNDVKFSLMDASQGKIGSTTDRFLLFCCYYDPNAGAYTGFAMGFMRVVGICMISFLLILIFVYYRKRKYNLIKMNYKE
ncbi:SCO family protein [Pigmentibacter sp. JX0631]|uniref:SCO family protein n=1 Tax=Pigmentibacter sp. JX0631 TaxID=2976982 RepID=UPI002469AD19|nr:SCO family protein [Pigmentibacter sp. JX0631]WGL59686.1 SCO family protein [Pigmentibacter sp. JX0631]